MANLQDLTNRSEVGVIKPWGKATAPAGYVLCDGAAISRTTYADLFAIISTTYGVGDGSSTFNVPDLQGKMPQGYDGSTYNMAGMGGANTVTGSVTDNQAVTVTGAISNTSLSEAQLASHGHTGSFNVTSQSAAPYSYKLIRVSDYVDTGDAGSGTGHTHAHTLAGSLTGAVTASGTNAFSPYVVVNYIIKH